MFHAEISEILKKGLVFKMNIYLKNFIHRGLIFGGFGPIILSIIYTIISKTSSGVILSGTEVALAILSTYLLAFAHAGASVFNQIEHWSVPKSILFHMSTLYVAYIFCYLVNTWIPFSPQFILVFTGIFVAIYIVVWVTVVTCIKITQKKLNRKLL